MTSDDVMGLRSLGGFALSPDGQTIAYSVSSWDKSGDNPVRRGHVWLVPSAGGAPKQLTFGDRSESAPRWAPDGKTISFVTARGGAEEKPQIWLLPVDGGEAHVLTHAKDGVETYAWSPDGSRIAYLSADAPSATDETKRKHHDDAIVFEQPTSRTHLWVASVPSGESHEVAHGDFTLSMLAIEGEPQWSPDGTRIAFVASPTGLLRDLRGTAYVATVATSTLDAISPEYRAAPVGLTQPVWSPDGRTLAFTTFPQGKLEGDSIPEPILNDGDIVLYDVASKKSRTMHEANQPATLTQLRWAPDGKSLLFVAADHVYQNVIAFDVASGHYRRLTTDKVIGSMSLNRDGSRVAFSMNTPTSPSDLYVSDLTFASPTRVTTLNPQVASLALGQTEVVTYKNDGLELQGILIKPVGYQPGQRYPLLVEAHGGPTGATLDGFQNNQVWAGRGWAVFMPNPRGSEGFGESFMRANILDLGGGDFRDIMAGVDLLVKRGLADSTRMAFEGWSYGGYMTAWVVGHTGRFKAARMGAGMSDLQSMYGTSEIAGYIGLFEGGRPTAATLAKYREQSPLTYADRVTTPLLILHGASDPRVPPGQSMEMYRALRDQGKPVELVLYPREQHALNEYAHLVDRMQRDSAWISRYTLSKQIQ
ncbi:MAG TPA: S9 family peptidase [Gemmatimonadaceae bacterium]|nr:S9 family peptidase [Gemmatimonadaceae bacterium]